MSLFTLLSLAAVFVTSSATVEKSAAAALPIWHPNNETVLKYMYFRSPEFTLPVPLNQIQNATLTITAMASPNVGATGGATKQSKLLFAYKLHTNGIVTTGGPGHNSPMSQQAMNVFDVSRMLRDDKNVFAISSYFNNKWGSTSEAVTPRVMAVLTIIDSVGQEYTLVPTSPNWTAFDATTYHNPDGNSDSADMWYVYPNENLDANVRQVGWADVGFVPAPQYASQWVNAAVQPAFPNPLYLEPAPAPAMLWRTPCNITQLASAGICGSANESQVLELTCAAYGGTINDISFASYGTPSGSCLLSNGSNTFAVGTCNSPNSKSVVQAACLGKASCSITPSNTLFGGDPCDKVAKWLSVAVSCSGGGGSGGQLYHYLVDYGQEFMGGVNITFLTNASAGAAVIPPNSSVTILLGEELLPAGGVMSPTRASENYTATWKLAASGSPNYPLANIGMSQHEFTQFRYAEIRNSPVPLDLESARAWVVQHPFNGNGRNPYEIPCATSTPNIDTYTNTSTSTGAGAQSYGWFQSSNAGLDAVFNLTAYTAIATSLELNVDSQTRQRDLCHIDALITGAEQFAVFATGDYGIQARTFRDAFGNDSAIWGSWTEFKQSGALMAYLYGMETGDIRIAEDVWSDDDMSITSDAYPTDFNSAQFYASVRYFNGSGNGLLHYPADCGGSWACDPLVDWPTTTRDGYVITGNDDDAVRNGLGALAIRGLAAMATWIGKTDAAARYTMMSDSIVSAMAATMLKFNISSSTGQAVEAYFNDGAGVDHAAVHSTLYAVSAGAADNNATLAALVAAYLRRKDVAPSSCMTGRWFVQALYQLGIQIDDAADFALELLSREVRTLIEKVAAAASLLRCDPTTAEPQPPSKQCRSLPPQAYPGWGYMVSIGASTTLEAWAPGQYRNDMTHEWTRVRSVRRCRLLQATGSGCACSRVRSYRRCRTGRSRSPTHLWRSSVDIPPEYMQATSGTRTGPIPGAHRPPSSSRAR